MTQARKPLFIGTLSIWHRTLLMQFSIKATLAFVDESSFSLLPTACRTWSPRG